MTSLLQHVSIFRALVTLCTLMAGLLLSGQGLALLLPEETVAPTAGKLFEQIKPSLLQIRVKLKNSPTMASSGSGFLVSPDGLVVTNYHVVTSVVMESDVYDLEYLRSDDSAGPLQIVALDVRNDLALLRIKGKGFPFLALHTAPLSKGERGYALGNPLNIGLTIAEGTYNGPVSNLYNELFHFTGALNPGMSGGPAVTDAGGVFGVNKAINLGGQLVGYVVPARYLDALLSKASSPAPKPQRQFRAEVNAQLLSYQEELARRLLQKPFPTRDVGRGYHAPVELMNSFECGGVQNTTPRSKITYNIQTCQGSSALSASNDLATGYVSFEHSLFEGDHLIVTQFASAYNNLFDMKNASDNSLKEEVGRYACKESLVYTGNSRMRVVLCERQYKKFDGLYDIQIKIATLNEPKAGLQSKALFSGFSHENGMRLAKRYLESLSWKP